MSKGFDWISAKALYIEGDKKHPAGVPPKEICKMLGISLTSLYKKMSKEKWSREKKQYDKSRKPNTKLPAMKTSDTVLKNLTDIYSGMVELTNQILEDAKSSDDVEDKLRALNVLGSTTGMSKVLKDIELLENERRKNEMAKTTQIPDNWRDMTLEELESYVNKDDSKIIDADSKGKK